MAEKLIIKNWGPIKDIDLNINKVTVIIGQQGTGKSIIAKLLYVLSSSEFLFNKEKERKNIIESYGFFFKKNTFISYQTINFEVKREKGIFFVKFTGKDRAFLENIFNTKSTLSGDNFDAFKSWFVFRNQIENLTGEYKYVPAERIALASTLRSIRETANRSIYKGNFDQYILDFANYYDKASENISSLEIPHLKNVLFKKENGNEKVNFNGENLFLYQTSSGFQVSIPLVILLEYYSKQTEGINKFIIEEPELNLFPEAQSKLIKYFIEKINSGNNQMIITTHSPYILTTLNNLIEASKIGTLRGKTSKVQNILPKKQWLNRKDVSVYQLLANGKSANIIAEDGSIKAENIDSVSNIINTEYDNLTQIKYGK